MSDILDLIDHAVAAAESWPDAVRWSPRHHPDERDGRIWVSDDEAVEIYRSMWRRKCRRPPTPDLLVWYDEAAAAFGQWIDQCAAATCDRESEAGYDYCEIHWAKRDTEVGG